MAGEGVCGVGWPNPGSWDEAEAVSEAGQRWDSQATPE